MRKRLIAAALTLVAQVFAMLFQHVEDLFRLFDLVEILAHASISSNFPNRYWLSCGPGLASG